MRIGARVVLGETHFAVTVEECAPYIGLPRLDNEDYPGWNKIPREDLLWVLNTLYGAAVRSPVPEVISFEPANVFAEYLGGEPDIDWHWAEATDVPFAELIKRLNES